MRFKKKLILFISMGAIAVIVLILLIFRLLVSEQVYLWGDAELTGFAWDASYFEHIELSDFSIADTPHGETAVNFIRHINDNLYGRVAFTYREKYKAKWIVEELLGMGFSWGSITIQEFNFNDVSDVWQDLGWTWRGWREYGIFSNFAIRSPRISQNVILTLPGQSDNVIIIGAHYDSFPYAGANDNASGTALLLESAARMREIDNYYTIVYVFFGAHEVGMLGAEYFVRNLSPDEHDNILFMLNADVIITGPYLIYGAGFDDNGAPGTNHITEIWDKIATELYCSDNFPLLAAPNFIFSGADQRVFLPFGHTVMFMVSGIRASISDEGIIQALSIPRHHPEDCYHYLNETQPGMIPRNMRVFSVFLEELLFAMY